MIQLINVKKKYSSELVLSIPKLDFPIGLFWIKGGNGSGKTTLLKMMAGLLPFEGTILLDGIDIKKNPVDYRCLVNYAEAEPLYPSFLTGHDLIQLFERTKKASAADVKSLIEVFGIHSFLKNPIGTYSSGMVKKLSLLLAFIGNPKVILLDEPLVTLEDHSIPMLLNQIAQYHIQKKVTFLFSSHQAIQTESFNYTDTLFVKDRTACFA